MKKHIILILMFEMIVNISLASTSITIFSQDETGFNTVVTNQLTFIDFDNISAGTNITNQTIQGVKFQTLGSPLMIVRGNDTYTPEGFTGIINADLNKLYPTSGENILSPGGIVLGPGLDNNIENDDLELIFDIPVIAFGFDHLSQSSDGSPYTYIDVFDISDILLYHELIPCSDLGGFAAPGGSDFWGIVSNTANIKRIYMSETDNNNHFPDSNTGYDTIRFAVPEPASLVLFFAVSLILRRK